MSIRTQVILFCLCLMVVTLNYMMLPVASPVLSLFHILQLQDQAGFPDVGTPCRDRARAAHGSQALSLSTHTAVIFLPLLFHHPRKWPSVSLPKTNPVFSDDLLEGKVWVSILQQSCNPVLPPVLRAGLHTQRSPEPGAAHKHELHSPGT